MYGRLLSESAGLQVYHARQVAGLLSRGLLVLNENVRFLVEMAQRISLLSCFHRACRR